MHDPWSFPKQISAIVKTARAAGVFVVFVRNVYISDRNFCLSDVWLECGTQAGRLVHEDPGLRG